ncbi:MAG: NAD-dependent epimerase/dehydratase family protein [Verrucomicrobiia bacterium]|jgi:CDP-paratose 2-epimerase
MAANSSKRRILVTGSNGLIGSEVCLYFAARGFDVSGIDNNQRAVFFGPQGDTRWNQRRLEEAIRNFHHYEVDVRDRAGIEQTVKDVSPQLIVHAAAQPSHDLAASMPFADFDTNAVGTLNMLEAARRHCLESPFVYLSTNKVYGDGPNTIRLKELETRWEYDDPRFAQGIPESFGVDQVLHSLFGASKLAADTLVQEYGRYFKMPTCCLRGGCLTGPNHSGVELHGFLSYLIKCNFEGKPYKVYGYKGKQVRDNIHSEDVAAFIDEFYSRPRYAEVYNIGGGGGNSCSILEAFAMVEQLSGRKQVYEYVDQNRIGDHICYYSDLRKMKEHYPSWSITKTLPQIFEEIAASWSQRLVGGAAKHR